MKRIICGLAVLAGMTLCGGVFAADAVEFKILKKEALGGDGGWDYLTVDAANRRLYIARESRVMVVDMETLKLVKEIPDTKGVHGVALVPEFNRGFITCGKDNKVQTFDMKTLEKTGEAAAGTKPDAIAYDPMSKRIFAFNNGGTTATAIDAATGKAVGSVELGGAPESGVSDGKGRIYVNLEDKSEVVAFDPVKLEVLKHWPLAPGKQPTGLAMDLEHRRLFSTCRASKTMVVLDADSGKIVASLPIGAGVDAAVFDAEAQLAFASNGDGSITVVHEDSPDKFTVVQTLKTMPGAKTMGFDSKTRQLWTVSAERKGKAIVEGSFSVIVAGVEKK